MCRKGRKHLCLNITSQHITVNCVIVSITCRNRPHHSILQYWLFLPNQTTWHEAELQSQFDLLLGFFFMLSVRRICCCSLLCHNSKGAFVQKSKSGVKKWKHTNMNTDEIRRYRDESTGPTTGSSTLQPPNVNVTGLSIICYQLRSSHRRCWVESGPRTPPESSDKIISCHLQNVLNEIHATE